MSLVYAPLLGREVAPFAMGTDREGKPCASVYNGKTMSLGHFLSYNNAVPVAVSILLLGAGGVFAATNPETLYSENEVVVSIDNTYLVDRDLSSYSPRTQIDAVTEDEENYYVAYTLFTIDLEEYVWRDVAKGAVMKVSKVALGPYRDLGVYVTEQLKENIAHESRRLLETQKIEREQVSQKVVATEYGGLIGKMLDTTTETLAGYTPVVASPPEVLTAAAGGSAPTTSAESGLPILQILGNNPASVFVGASYADLGAVITGPTDADRNLGIKIFVNDVEMATPVIDTSQAANWFIRYEVTNGAGRQVTAERVVLVTDPNVPAAESEVPIPVSEGESTGAEETSEGQSTEETSEDVPLVENMPESNEEVDVATSTNP